MASIDGSSSFFANLFLSFEKCSLNLSELPKNNMSYPFSFLVLIYAVSLVMSSSDIFIGGLALQLLALRAVIDFCSVCMSVTFKPLSP